MEGHGGDLEPQSDGGCRQGEEDDRIPGRALRDRTGETITELPGTNQALVAGGINSSGTYLSSASVLGSSPASVTTDKLDYAPGTTAILVRPAGVRGDR